MNDQGAGQEQGMPAQDLHAGGTSHLLQIINAVADPIFVKDRSHRWVLLNDAFCELMGHARADLLGKSDYDFFPKNEADIFWRKDEEVFRSGQENVNEEFVTDGQGRTRTIITKKTLYADGRGEPFIVGIIRDITDLRRTAQELEKSYERMVSLQARLIQSEKMASIGQLMAGIAHELNNPTAYILSNMHMLKDYVEQLEQFIKELPHDTFERPSPGEGGPAALAGRSIFTILEDIPPLLLETIQGAEKIHKIVADLRLSSHPGDGGMEYADLNACLDRALEIVGNSYEDRIDIVRDYGDIPKVCFNPQRLLQAFINLITNALHSISGHGKVTIRTRARGDEVFIEIRDTGAGIPPENLPRVFDPFFTTKPVGQGTGLGLSVVHGIIEKHRGAITATSVPGEETVFAIRLWRHGPNGSHAR